MRLRRRFSALVAAMLIALTIGVSIRSADAGPVLDRIKDDGYLRCGLTASGSGLSEINKEGIWTGFFVEFCRALAAAVLDDADAIQPVEVDDIVRFDALADGAFDVLMANTTWTIGRDTARGLMFGNVLYFDGQGFLAHRNLGATTLDEVQTGTICVPGGTTTVKNLHELTAGLDRRIDVIEFSSQPALYDAFFSHRCDIITYDRMVLSALRQRRANNPADYVLFPEIISKEPLSSVVSRGDDAWFQIVRWASWALLAAEELGVTQANVEDMRNSELPEIRRLLGTDADIGEGMELTNDWVVRMVRAVGNFGEIYERFLGGNGLQLPRGLNGLWKDGGLHYVPPIR